METKLNANKTLKILHVMAWIFYIALMVEAGAIIVNTFITLFINPEGAKNFWEKVDFTAIYNFDSGHFLILTLVMSIVAVLKILLFHQIIKLFSNKTLSFSQPFTSELKKFMLNFTYLAFAIGLFSNCGANFYHWLTTQGIPAIDMKKLHLEGGDVWIFMSVLFFIAVQVVKKGIEIQSENELTV
ncbi:DUF2975 domain-containing protein [Algoriphagus winogradskyi]|jgi:hypothetical protein|uniref:DUF2975 domain-containing protein n=1 Tax=Algoriphagus winogradskyi TaxID=237017 RepID=A0ABY1PJV3_9BACT|nr:DUF2975 domain-containing protein [Algoriphagus winogradskyi]SMP35899.1 Protein of unknown function [Algoriphagus winogradskyi]